MKRAGMILGVVFIIVAILLNVGIQRKKSGVGKKEKPVKQEVIVEKEVKKEAPKQEVQEEPKAPVEPEVVEVIKEVIKVETKEISSIVEIQEGDIKEYDLREEIMTIDTKKLLVLDMAKDEREDKAIIYVFKSKDSRGLPITMVVNEVVYETKKVGDRLQVKYKVTKNTNNVEFAAIQSIKEVE